MKLLSKFMVYRAPTYKIYLSLRLRSPLKSTKEIILFLSFQTCQNFAIISKIQTTLMTKLPTLTVKTLIRLLLLEQSYQSLHCLPSHMSRIVRKPAFCICENKDATAKLISAFVFATWIVQSLYFLNLKFQESSHLLYLYSPVCVGPGRKPRRPVFSQLGSYYLSENCISLFNRVGLLD